MGRGTATLSVDNWGLLKRDLFRRSKEPWGHTTFVVFFALGVFAYGMLGTWFELIRWAGKEPGAGPESCAITLITFFPALVGSTSLQVLLDEKENRDRRFRAFALFVGPFFFIWAAIAAFLPLLWQIKLLFSILGVAAALWVWVVANADHPALKDQVDVDDSVGGPTDTPPAGDVTTYKV